MSAETKVTEANQTQVPAALRAKYGVRPGDVLVWEDTPDGEVRVRFRRRYALRDLVGAFPARPGRRRSHDAVRDKKRAQRGEL
ncbi:MAG: AbrB/MazE/SpoVT family DNA-binding domain-containing protein [Methanobacteriota archaeon]